MKKIISILLISLLLCGTAFAVDYTSTDKGKVMMAYTIANPDAGSTGGTNNANLITAVSTSTIVPGTHRIIGFEIAPMSTTTNSELWANIADTTSAIFKATTADTAPTGQFAESEAVNNESLYRIYPYPVEIGTQLVVRQGQNTVVTIYYDRK